MKAMLKSLERRMDMERLRNAFYQARIAAGRFMLGRNGMDQLNYALLWGYLGLCVIRALIVWVTRSFTVGRAFDVALDVILVAIAFRSLSRNLPRRQSENLRWLDLRRRAERRIGAAARRRADKEHKYFTCKQCGTVCRVPTGKGNIVITCPKCGEKIQART